MHYKFILLRLVKTSRTANMDDIAIAPVTLPHLMEPEPQVQPEPEPELECVIADDIPSYPLRTTLDHALYPRWTMGTGDVQDCPTVQRGMVYVAVCAQEFIYVGYVTASGNIAARISMHMSNAGSRLTREYPISYIHSCIYPATKRLEQRVMQWFAENAPPRFRVRGGAYCNPNQRTPFGI